MPDDADPDPLLQRAAGKVTKVLSNKSEDGSVSYPTGGTPYTVKTTQKSRKPFHSLKSPVKRRKAREMDEHRKVICGGKNELHQWAYTLKRLPFPKRKYVCELAGVKQGAHITKQLGLALKCRVGLSWAQRDKVQSVLSSIGITQENKNAQREEKTRLIGDHLYAKKIQLEFKNDLDEMETRPTPIVGVKNIKNFLFERIESYYDHGLLTWHQSKNGTLPLDRIFVKVGGDKGQGSMKLTLQVCNVPKPNSPDNTLIITQFEANDTYANLAVTMDGIQHQLEDIDGCQWIHSVHPDISKKIELVGTGDLDFISKVQGMAGASCTYPCTNCKIHKDEMQIPKQERAPSEKRTQKNLEEDYLSFTVQGNCDSKQQSKFFNVLNPTLLHIEPDHYCIPWLHILLGVIKKMHEMMEAALHCLDEELELADKESDLCRSDVQEFYRQKKKILKLSKKQTEKIHYLRSIEEECDDDLTIAQIRGNMIRCSKVKKQVEKLENEINQLKSKYNLKKCTGPLCKHLEDKLQENSIKRQVYHGRSFVGNDCNKYTKPKVISSICDGITSKALEITSQPDIIIKSRSIASKFHKLFSMFSGIHRQTSHSRFLTEDDILMIDRSIKNFCEYFREKFPTVRFTLKLHLLEDHAVANLMKYRFGMGLLGEQGNLTSLFCPRP